MIKLRTSYIVPDTLLIILTNVTTQQTFAFWATVQIVIEVSIFKECLSAQNIFLFFYISIFDVAEKC